MHTLIDMEVWLVYDKRTKNGDVIVLFKIVYFNYCISSLSSSWILFHQMDVHQPLSFHSLFDDDALYCLVWVLTDLNSIFLIIAIIRYLVLISEQYLFHLCQTFGVFVVLECVQITHFSLRTGAWLIWHQWTLNLSESMVHVLFRVLLQFFELLIGDSGLFAASFEPCTDALMLLNKWYVRLVKFLRRIP